MVRDEKISLFYRQYKQEFREIIDYLSGMLFEYFPNIIENIKEDRLSYKMTSSGSMFNIKICSDTVLFEIKRELIIRNKNINSHIFKVKKRNYFLEYNSYKSIDKKLLHSILINIR